MHLLQTTLDTLAANLALDESLLLSAEEGGPQVLRLWEWPSPAVVLGAGCKLAEDVDDEACQARGVPISRRGSGGGTVLLGHGCLLFSLILAYAEDPALADIRSSYRWILARIAAGVATLHVHVQPAGISDLILAGRKVSGNAQQRKRGHLLHHGTLLYGFAGQDVSSLLPNPARQPDYRQQRSHADFLGNLPLPAAELRRAMAATWNAAKPLTMPPLDRANWLVAEKYGTEEWIRRR
jgi:lipoate---protein ligase